jgi:hypothetical protein
MGVTRRFPGYYSPLTTIVGELLIGADLLIRSGVGPPVDGAGGTGADAAGPGSTYLDAATGNEYFNVGPRGAPTWLLIGGADHLRLLTIALTNAQLLNCRATPVVLVAAPGAGFRWELLEGTINLNLTAAYTETADNLAIKYANGAGVQASETIEATGLVDQTGKIHSNIVGKKDAIATEAQSVNQALVLHNIGDAEFGAGHANNVGRLTLAVRRVAVL